MDERSTPRSSAVPDLTALADFVTVAEVGHLTRAAELLGVPQSTLSRRVSRLEASLGAPLLRRTGRGVTPTPAAVELARAAARGLHDVDRAVAAFTARHDPDAGLVSMAFLHTLGPVAVPRLLSEYRASHPAIRFQLVQEPHEAIMASLRSGEADVALTAPRPDSPDLAARELQRQPLGLVVPAGHRLSGRRGIRLADLAEHAFIGFKPGYGLRRISDDWCARAGFAPTVSFEGEDVATVRGLVAAGLGIALLPLSPGGPAAGTAEVPVHTPRESRSVCVTWVADATLAGPAAAFRDFLVERGRELLGTDPAERDR
jgi:DNA-binding transcriptional LysR family regulator